MTESLKTGDGLEQPLVDTANRPSKVAALLAQFPVIVDLPVAWGEMDAMGHVNGVVFLRYFETSRFTYFARLGPALEGMGTAERGWILASLACRYRTPLTFPDTVSVGTRVAAVGIDCYMMEHRVVSHRLGRVAAEGDVLIVAYDYRTGSKTPLIGTDRAAIAAVEGYEPPAMNDRGRLDGPDTRLRRRWQGETGRSHGGGARGVCHGRVGTAIGGGSSGRVL